MAVTVTHTGWCNDSITELHTFIFDATHEPCINAQLVLTSGAWHVLVTWRVHVSAHGCNGVVLMHPVLHAGYGMLGPVARYKGWAPGPIGDWKNGATGWVLWISLAIMLGDSLTSLSLLLITSLQRHITAVRSDFISLLLLLLLLLLLFFQLPLLLLVQAGYHLCLSWFSSPI